MKTSVLQQWLNEGYRKKSNSIDTLSFLEGVYDFKAALREKIEAERNYCKELLDAGFEDSQSEDRCYAKFEFCNTLLSKLIDEVTPLSPTQEK